MLYRPQLFCFFFNEFAEYVGYLVTSTGFVLLTGDFTLHVDSSEDFISAVS